ncbi:phosphotriesterase [Streptomyces sp. CB02923]|uniref:phosphotriesterase family protein n=1 Tax=Streptomyces sp. CB02923 TaxID=1718985 RepID=UPI00093C10DC|nr:phosphotriesterase [Streptomyces sp. CB02923]OKI10085.1 phosphotriesterase [Streptomyces sp. CB02923]
MSNIPTAAGVVESEQLGKTLVHEHVFVMGEEYRLNYDREWNEEEKVAQAVSDLNGLKALGIDSIMDPTVLGLGRYIPRIQAVAQQTDLNIVVATGLYTWNDMPQQFGYRGPGEIIDRPEPLTELFVRDITEGIAGTGVRAAFLKCAIDEPGLTHGVERTMRAVARAGVETGVPVTVHTHAASRSGLVAQRLLLEEGVEAGKIIIGHSGDSTDLAYLIELADNGSLLGMDRFGVDVFLPFEQRVATVVELVRRGYVESLVLSHDASCHIDFFDDPKVMGEKWNYRHISEDVLPALRAAGVSEDEIHTMLVTNVRHHFG